MFLTNIISLNNSGSKIKCVLYIVCGDVVGVVKLIEAHEDGLGMW